jgi:hypothetical protein
MSHSLGCKDGGRDLFAISARWKKNLAHTVSEFAATAWVPIAGEITHQAPLFTHFLYHILLAQPIHTVHLFYFFFILHKVSHRMVP